MVSLTQLRQHQRGNILNTNALYVVIGALLVAVIGFGVYAYREETKPQGVELKLDNNGVSIQKN